MARRLSGDRGAGEIQIPILIPRRSILMALASRLVAIAAAVSLAVIGVRYGTYAAGGSDSSCYALMAEAFASGRLQPSSALISEVPWPDAQKTFTPGGFSPSQG